MAGSTEETEATYAVGWLILLAQFATIIVAVVYLLLDYPNPKRTPWFTYITVGVSWTLSISSLVLLPLDIASFLYKDCTTRKTDCAPPINYIGQDALKALWGIIYWCGFILSWFVLSYQRSWIKSGAFTVKRKIFLMARFNLIKWAIVITVVIIAVIAMAFEKNILISIGGWAGLKGLLVSLLNVYGLTFVHILMGVGMVEIPRRMWQNSNIEANLERTKLKIYQLSLERDDAEARLGEVIEKIFQYTDAVEEEDELAKVCDTLLLEIPEDYNTAKNIKGGNRKGAFNASAKPVNTTLGKLENLRQDLRSSTIQHDRAQLRYAHVIKRAYFLEDCLDSLHSEGRVFKRSLGADREVVKIGCCAARDWWWYLVIAPLLGKVGAVVFTVMAGFILLNELLVISGRSPDLSILSLTIRGVGDVTFIRQIFICIPLGYMCMCIYFSLFKWKVMQLYRMHRKRHTEGVSLLFNAYFVGRFTPALNYNFLDMLHLVDQESSTVYSEQYGRMDLVAYLDQIFTWFFPFFLCTIVVLAAFDVWGFLWNKMYKIALEGTRAEQIEEGVKLLEIERRKHFSAEQRKKRLDDARKGAEWRGGAGGGGLGQFDSLKGTSESSSPATP